MTEDDRRPRESGRASGGRDDDQRYASSPPRTGQTRERMSADYDEPAPRPRQKPRAEGRRPRGVTAMTALLGSDQTTRTLGYAAGGIAVVLIGIIGGWSLLGGPHSGIPIIAPPPGPEREKPADPGGMQIVGMNQDLVDTSGHGEAHLAPGPEQPRPDALAKRYGQEPTAMPQSDTSSLSTEATGPAPADKPSAPPPSSSTPLPSAPPAQATPPLKDDKESEDAPKTASAAPKVPPATAPESTPAGQFFVQFAAVKTQGDAQHLWVTLQGKAPALLSSRAPVIQPVSHNGATLYRLRTGGFETIEAAKAFCVKIHARTIPCFPTRP